MAILAVIINHSEVASLLQASKLRLRSAGQSTAAASRGFLSLPFHLTGIPRIHPASKKWEMKSKLACASLHEFHVANLIAIRLPQQTPQKQTPQKQTPQKQTPQKQTQQKQTQQKQTPQKQTQQKQLNRRSQCIPEVCSKNSNAPGSGRGVDFTFNYLFLMPSLKNSMR